MRPARGFDEAAARRSRQWVQDPLRVHLWCDKFGYSPYWVCATSYFNWSIH